MEFDNKTLLFCTSYFDNNYIWENRYLKWINYFNSIKINKDKVLIIDDGSPRLPQDERLPVIFPDTIKDEEPEGRNLIIHFSENLGRPEMLNYPGWFRSFSYASQYAKLFNYKKIIHIESDIFILSKRILNYINDLNSGWVSFTCRRHGFPESGIQIICEDQLENLEAFCKKGYSSYKGTAIEVLLPFTKVENGFIGDRYGEYMHAPPANVDYCSQYLPEWKI